MTPKASMTDIIVHLNAKVSPLLPLFLRACAVYFVVKSWFLDVDAEAAAERCASIVERHFDRFLKVSVTAEG